MTAKRAKGVVKVAAGQGFWGDWLEAPRRQVEGGDIDYLMLDYLAEVTMSILQKQKERDPNLGYARDFVGAVESVLPAVVVRDRVLSANAYIGSGPIAEALSRGAQVVITGRSTDTALTMAPLRYEFGWRSDDWDRLAAGIIAGHIIECGAQCSGGNCLYEWQTIPNLADVGYPIVEGRADGTFVITKHPRTGGCIS